MKILIYVAVYGIVFLHGIVASQELPQLHIVGQPDPVQDGFVSSDIKDANGRICAGLMVVSDLVGFAYESNNGVVKVSRSPGQDIVYVSPDERVLEIYFSGFEPLKIILSERGINLETKRIWRLKITGDIIKVGTGALTIETVPSGLGVILNGAQLATQTPLTLNELPAVEYRIEVDGGEFYIGDDTTFVLRKDETTRLSMNLIRKTGKLYVSTTPSGVDVYLDDHLAGTSPLSIEDYPTGDYALKLLKRDYDTYHSRISVNWNQRTDINLGLSSEGTKAWKQRRATSIKRSLLLPGGGQLVSGQSIRGWTYMGLFVGSAAIAIKGYIDFTGLKNDYNRELDAINRPGSSDERMIHYNAAIRILGSMRDKKNKTEIFVTITMGVYALQLLDALIWGGGPKPNSASQIKSSIYIDTCLVDAGTATVKRLKVIISF